MSASKFKSIHPSDIAQTRTKLHEAIPVTGTILSGTYSDNNIKNYAHGMFQSVYDYPYLSSSANHIIDLTAGWSSTSGLSGSTNVSQRNQKNDIYNEMAQVLAGYDATGSINKFDVSGSFSSNTAADKMNEVVIFNFSRLLQKDEIQRANNGFTITLGVSASYSNPFGKTMRVYDKNGTDTVYTNTPAGEFGILYASSSDMNPADQECGLLFYQAGVAVLTASVFTSTFVENCQMNASSETIQDVLTSGSISGSCDALRHRVQNIDFNNTTELNSSIYFCRVFNSDFNYSSNPTYLSSSQPRVKELATDPPVSYITTVGLYNKDGVLVAVSKLSEPLKKSPEQEYSIRVRLDH